ncbi:DsrE family protein [Erythrobacter sp. JK5]|uniref:DsrE family protein n=1 Tax=Erythrobacter sp. JK5 TaxID=2829500 RepID=UPI001BA5E201|nr:DsrE family protein [Erythrobacter sp. JK5]QUL37748.1 DsrE family protein [Erythrobacter sp. JK5]
MQRLAVLTTALLLAAPATAQDLSAFNTGPVFEEFGPHAPIEGQDFAIPDGMDLFVAFDTATPAEGGRINRTIESAARFVNMHAAAGVEPARVRAAVVVHGGAAVDLLTAKAWTAKGKEGSNRTAGAIPALLDNGVRIILCGQSAAAQGITKDDLVPGVELALSAMTAHAVLQRQGYTVNPF